MLATKGLWKIFFKAGSSSSTTTLTPGFCKPTEFSIPMGHSAIRGRAFPSLGSTVVPLKEMEPKIFKS